MLYVFTSCALNFVPCAKLLAASVKTHMPDAHFVLVLTDDKPEQFRLEDEGFDEVLYLDDFADQFDNPRGWAFGHSIMELATAVKPFTAAKLMERDDCDGVMFFDPDCVLFGAMAQMRKALQQNSVLLTPHASLMHEDRDWLFFERTPLKVGGFNLGFFGLQNNETGRAVASWWRYRLRDLCLIDPDQGLFTDQKWIDLLPNYIDDIKVMREPVYNIARWNTFQRVITKKVAKRSGKVTYLADGQPVEFVHFSGFYKIGPYVQGLYDKSSEPLIEDLTTLQELSLWYSEQLEEARSHPEYTAAWKLGHYGSGEEIPEQDRRRYKASRQLQAQYPDPFAVTGWNNYWLYCRKQARIETDTQLADLQPNYDLINNSVRAHNTLLRKQNSAFEAQFSSMVTEIAALRELDSSRNQRAGDFQQKVLEMLRHTAKSRVQKSFGWMQQESMFDPNEYLEQNPDVRQSKLSPLQHFIMFGLYERRNCGDINHALFVEQYSELLLALLRPPKVSEIPSSIKKMLLGNA